MSLIWCGNDQVTEAGSNLGYRNSLRSFAYAPLNLALDRTYERAGAPGKPGPGEIAVDIDRRNRILGNPFVLHDPTDAAARNEVIERFRAKYEADLKCDGPMSAATEALAERVRKGERLVCMCWCWPKRCHGAIIIDEIKRRLE